MNYTKYFFRGIFVSAFFLSIFSSCTKEDLKKKNSTNVINVNTRTINDNKEWLESFRQNLITNSTNSYSTSDVEYGIESLFNLLGTNGVRFTERVEILESNFEVTPINNNLTKSQILSLFNSIYTNVKNAYDLSTKVNKGLPFIDIQKQLNQNSITYNVRAFIGNNEVPNFNSGILIDLCTNEFNSSDCFRSAVESFNGSISSSGGPCGSPNSLTSAQVEIEKKINKSIPTTISSKFGLQGIIKYVDVECMQPIDITHSNAMRLLIENSSNCKNIDFEDFFTTNDLEYNFNKLNCSMCLIKQFLNTITPPGKVLSSINIVGDILDAGAIVWRIEPCFAKPIFISVTIPTNPGNPLPNNDGGGFLSSNSIFNIL